MVVPAFYTGRAPGYDLLDRCTDGLRRSRAASAERPAVRTSLATTAKAPALLARAGGFDGGVEREDVGLERTCCRRADDVGNAARALVDLARGGHHLAHHLAATPRLGRRTRPAG